MDEEGNGVHTEKGAGLNHSSLPPGSTLSRSQAASAGQLRTLLAWASLVTELCVS